MSSSTREDRHCFNRRETSVAVDGTPPESVVLVFGKG